MKETSEKQPLGLSGRKLSLLEDFHSFGLFEELQRASIGKEVS